MVLLAEAFINKEQVILDYEQIILENKYSGGSIIDTEQVIVYKKCSTLGQWYLNLVVSFMNR